MQTFLGLWGLDNLANFLMINPQMETIGGLHSVSVSMAKKSLTHTSPPLPCAYAWRTCMATCRCTCHFGPRKP